MYVLTPQLHAVRGRVPLCSLRGKAAAVPGSVAAWRPQVATRHQSHTASPHQPCPPALMCALQKEQHCPEPPCQVFREEAACISRSPFEEGQVRCRALGAGQDLKEFDVDNAYGLAALKRILEDCVGNTLHMEAVKVVPGFLLSQAAPGRLHPILKELAESPQCRM